MSGAFGTSTTGCRQNRSGRQRCDTVRSLPALHATDSASSFRRISWRQFDASRGLPLKFSFNYLDRLLREIDADLVYFTCPPYLAQVTENYNYLLTLWDLNHREQVDFPEIRVSGEFERREHLYRSTLNKATGVVVGSDAGRDNVVRRYGVDGERVHVVPFSPAVGTLLSDDEYWEKHIDIKAMYGLQYDYVYYPARFWPHKNHVYILRGLRMKSRFPPVRPHRFR